MNEQEELLEFSHIPFRKPRVGIPFDGIYLDLWVEYVKTDPKRLEEILRDLCSSITQRDVSICASFMSYMGCNAGQFLHQEAERLQTQHELSSSDAFALAWRKHNERKSYVNKGLRLVEYMLATEYPILQTARFHQSVHPDLVPEISMRDLEVVDAMVDWWSSYSGQEMRKIGEHLIEFEKKKALSNLFRTNGDTK